MSSYQPDIIKRFMDKVKITDTCWLWTASMKTERYGAFNLNKKIQFSHRVAYRLFIGEIPDNMEVCHQCDVTTCVNPKHLFLGTHKDNMMDSAKKGRLNNSRAKLNPEKIRYIRKQYSQGVNQADLCREFNYSTGNMSNIISGKSWAHVV